MSAQRAVFAGMNAKYLAHSLICLTIMYGFGLLSPLEPLTPLGMSIIGVFLGDRKSTRLNSSH